VRALVDSKRVKLKTAYGHRTRPVLQVTSVEAVKLAKEMASMSGAQQTKLVRGRKGTQEAD
jgi:hypothetical protein